MKGLIILIILISISSAIFMLAPTEKEVRDGDLIDLGEIGPGQTITLYFAPDVTVGGIYREGGRYDFAQVTSITPGWEFENSKHLGFPLQVKITAAKDANEGEYRSNITISDEKFAEKLENVTIQTKVKITLGIKYN